MPIYEVVFSISYRETIGIRTKRIEAFIACELKDVHDRVISYAQKTYGAKTTVTDFHSIIATDTVFILPEGQE